MKRRAHGADLGTQYRSAIVVATEAEEYHQRYLRKNGRGLCSV